LATPSSSAVPSLEGITQLDPTVAVKEELDYFPMAAPNTNLACIVRLLANQLDEQAQLMEAQTIKLQAQIAILTAQLKELSANWVEQLEKKDVELQREQIARQLEDQQAEEHVTAMKVMLAEAH
jgi:hypothetical protein